MSYFSQKKSELCFAPYHIVELFNKIMIMIQKIINKNIKMTCFLMAYLYRFYRGLFGIFTYVYLIKSKKI